jgi:hypothetical protein
MQRGPGRRGQPDQVGPEALGLDAKLAGEPAEADPRLDRDVAELELERGHPGLGEAGQPHHLHVRVGDEPIVVHARRRDGSDENHADLAPAVLRHHRRAAGRAAEIAGCLGCEHHQDALRHRDSPARSRAALSRGGRRARSCEEAD